ncbi:hypothetical protein JSQ81_13705 [Sporosarcina sp. Marseille-Q4063]|uniref:hypothetical protein n=1 Tax=Sporosarcina sp. Marseille-Q4063 TaxID=2810514 RepID=UPI001BAF33A0|nr:hypothetical protein [Sporosarcina sp. Marseille-Q4063]QUW20867.1 hypothetical protein JSQ81_13705 [Sporosarcina sp. Marseille-Q4063]
MSKTRVPGKKILLYSLIILCFIMMESPMVLLANKIEPIILGIPFLLFWTLIWWFALTVLFLIGYLINWGSETKTN